MLLIPTSTVYGPGGEVYEGPGVAPDVELQVCQTFAGKTSEEGRKSCLDAALAYITAHPRSAAAGGPAPRSPRQDTKNRQTESTERFGQASPSGG